MKLLKMNMLALAIVAGSAQLAQAKMIPTGNDKCPFVQGGICYSLPGKVTGTCGDLDTVSVGGKNYCKLGPKNNPKPVPKLREPLQTEGING